MLIHLEFLFMDFLCSKVTTQYGCILFLIYAHSNIIMTH